MRSVVQNQYHGEDVIGIPQTSVTRLNRKRGRKRNGFHWLPYQEKQDCVFIWSVNCGIPSSLVRKMVLFWPNLWHPWNMWARCSTMFSSKLTDDRAGKAPKVVSWFIPPSNYRYIIIYSPQIEGGLVINQLTHPQIQWRSKLVLTKIQSVHHFLDRYPPVNIQKDMENTWRCI